MVPARIGCATQLMRAIIDFDHHLNGTRKEVHDVTIKEFAA